MLVFKIAHILDDQLAQAFWDALLDKNDLRARSSMAGFCLALCQRVNEVADERSRDVIREALEWAAANPEALEFVYSDKVGRKGHLPNMVGFGTLLAGIERQSNFWNRPVEIITHDRQQEFKKAIQFWHTMFSNARDDVVNLGASKNPRQAGDELIHSPDGGEHASGGTVRIIG